MKTLLLPSCLLIVVLVPVAAQAIYITNVTTGVTLFNDDFELAPGVSHTATPDLTGDYNPVPSVGSYLIQEGDPSIGQVTDFSDGTNAGPGADQGNNYFRIFHNGAGHEYQAELASTPADGDLIHVEFKAYFTANTGGNQSVFKIRGDGLGGDAQRAGGRAGEGGVVFDLNGDPTSLTYAVGQWQKWEFDYTIGQDTYTMKVDGVSSGLISNLTRGGPGNIEGFGFWSGAVGSSYYLDSTLPPLIPGDINGDGDVDLVDYGILKSHWLQSISGLSNGDLNADSVVDILDFGLFKQFYIAANGGGGQSLRQYQNRVRSS